MTARDIAQPIELVRALRGLGVTLRKAHEAVDRLARGEVAFVSINGAIEDFAARLSALGAHASPTALPIPDIKRIRAMLGVSQSEFAMRFGLELDTVQNWEQGRYAPDPAARVLLRVIERHPAIVSSVLTG